MGFAMETEGKLPINGVRPTPAAETNGWYVGVVKSFLPSLILSSLFTRQLIEKFLRFLNHWGYPQVIGPP